ncbi:sacsin N-terminal ATP-binding-like domain-containing protein [Nocardia sp. NPDC052566]|uniref:sacsin N-terminal ATP-binding-like domain-containing protein n=1 Tax=Nocardia sp. NPDC052566 TaxID=3364330 RepID=UPI0037C621E8
MREDAATEADLVRAGYRDRLLTELAQNAADAAAKAGSPGRVSVRLDGGTLSIANTGAPLDLPGVHALTALRASGKADPAATVGRFGVGFTAVRSVADELEIRSITGGLRFSAQLTRDALRDNAIDTQGSASGAGDFVPPVLRLAWPVDTPPTNGADTEVVLHLRDDIDAAALLEAMRAEAADLLLELPALHGIRIGDDEFTSELIDTEQPGLQELRIGGPHAHQRIWWQFRTERARWLLPIRDGRPVPTAPDVLRAPTRSDEELSLPALLIADIAMQPDRRRLLPGARLTELATGYADFAAALPPRDRLVLVPPPAFARSEADGLLREALIRELQTNPWLPVVAPRPARTGARVADEVDPLADDHRPLAEASEDHGWLDDSVVHGVEAQARVGVADLGESVESTARGAEAQPGPGTVDSGELGDSFAERAGAVSGPSDIPPQAEPSVVGASVDETLDPWSGGSGVPVRRGAVADAVAVPTRASVFTGLTAELAALLDDVVGPLVVPELAGRAQGEALGVLDVHRLGLARLAELSGGLERPPSWWRELYEALEPFVVDPLAAEELGALAVPLADGRLVTGPRTVVLDDQLAEAIPVHWARLVHPEATHPLLARLGARSAAAVDLLSDPALHAELEDNPGDPDTADAVLRLAAHVDPAALPSWLGLLELPDTAGDSRPADELLLPDAPLADLLVADSPFGTADPELVDRYGEDALRAVGVGWDFGVVVESDPTGPDHDLDDEDAWWSSLSADPPELTAVRDLDLVDDAAWPQALRYLAFEPRTRRLLTDPDGYTAWWLRRHARLDGIPLGHYRHPADAEFAGLLPEFAVAGLTRGDVDALRAVLANPAGITQDLAAALLDALADPARMPEPEVVSRVNARLAAAVAADHLDLTALELPDKVRALSGAVVDAADALVLDRPWFGLALPPDRLVFGDVEHAPALATLLDLPLVSEQVTAEVLSTGRRGSWTAEPIAVVLRRLWGLPPQEGELVLHTELRVRLRGAWEATIAVPYWREGTTTHVAAPHAPGYTA